MQNGSRHSLHITSLDTVPLFFIKKWGTVKGDIPDTPHADNNTDIVVTESVLISGGVWRKKMTIGHGVPRWAEKIPVEPDLGNASVGSGDWCMVRDSQ
jgi:hypothetical protein